MTPGAMVPGEYLLEDGEIALNAGRAGTVLPVANGGGRPVHNSALPRMEVAPETYEVRADCQLLVCEAATVLPMAQRYFLL